jgi:hypothetical protein
VLASLSSQRLNDEEPARSVGQGIESVAASNLVCAGEPTGHEVSSPFPKKLQPVPDVLQAHHIEGNNLESVAARRLGDAPHIPGLITADITPASLVLLWNFSCSLATLCYLCYVPELETVYLNPTILAFKRLFSSVFSFHLLSSK